jgi:hypothetical protein
MPERNTFPRDGGARILPDRERYGDMPERQLWRGGLGDRYVATTVNIAFAVFPAPTDTTFTSGPEI